MGNMPEKIYLHLDACHNQESVFQSKNFICSQEKTAENDIEYKLSSNDENPSLEDILQIDKSLNDLHYFLYYSNIYYVEVEEEKDRLNKSFEALRRLKKLIQ